MYDKHIDSATPRGLNGRETAMAANKEGEMRKNFRILGMAGVLFAAITAVTPAIAQDWPTRPIKLLVGFGPGGGTDIAARIVADGLTEVLGQPVVV